MSASNQKPSVATIDHAGSNQAIQRPRYLILDDTNVDLITVLTTTWALLAPFIFKVSYLRAALTAAAIIVPLRASFPLASKPTGLALITGASSGIGAELAYIFARNGNDVILVARSEDQLNAVKENIKSKWPSRSVYIETSDLSVPGAAKNLYDTVIGKGMVVDILVNNAGVGGAGDVMEQSEDLPETIIYLNCIALVQLTQLFGKDMVKRGKGWILELTSVAGACNLSQQSNYLVCLHLSS